MLTSEDQNQSLLITFKEVTPLRQLTESIETLGNYSVKQPLRPSLKILLRFAIIQIVKSSLSFLTCHLFTKFRRNHARGHQLRSKFRCQKKFLRPSSTKMLYSRMMLYKESFISELYATVEFLQSSFIMSGVLTSLPQLVSGYRGSSALKQDKVIASLLGVPVSKQSFWRNIYTYKYI